MAVPGFQEVMLPLLKLLSDGKEHNFREVIETLSTKFNLTEDERKELLQSGQQVFNNRVGWARTYMKKAGLLDSPRRAVIQITERGEKILDKKPKEISVKFLNQFPEFVEFHTAKRIDDDKELVQDSEDQQTHTPEERLEVSYQEIRKSLAQELINKVINLPPSFFERLVVELLVKMGYGGSIKDAGKAIGKSGDEGIDGTIKEDKLGLDIIYIQAKRWQKGNIVGRPEIHKFIGALAGQGAKKGIFITTSFFSKDALEFAPKNETKIVLIDGAQLAQYMIDFNLGVTLQQVYELKRLDGDYFGDE